MDLVKEATDNLSLQLNRDLSIFVDVGAEKIFDEVYCVHVLELVLCVSRLKACHSLS